MVWTFTRPASSGRGVGAGGGVGGGGRGENTGGPAGAGPDPFVAGSAIFSAGKPGDPNRYNSVVKAMRDELAKAKG